MSLVQKIASMVFNKYKKIMLIVYIYEFGLKDRFNGI